MSWINNVDLDNLTTEERTLYEAYRQQRVAAGKSRAAFEACLNKRAPKGKRFAFNYRFGGLSLNVVDGDYKPLAEKPAKARPSLSQWLDANDHNPNVGGR